MAKNESHLKIITNNNPIVMEHPKRAKSVAKKEISRQV